MYSRLAVFSLLSEMFYAISYAQQPAEADNTCQADVTVYGGTSAAVAAAVQVVRMGKSVIMVSPDKHLGELSSSGLGFTDTGRTRSTCERPAACGADT